jgi:hypothetical protein
MMHRRWQILVAFAACVYAYVMLVMYAALVAAPRRPLPTEAFSGSADPSSLCVCMLYTSNIASYAGIAHRINRAYADAHGYRFRAFHDRLSDRAPTWDKLPAIAECMREQGCRHVFWIDADAYFSDHTKRLEDVVGAKAFERFDLNICDDTPNSGGICDINCGAFLAKNSPYMRAFLDQWWNASEQRHIHGAFHEQTTLDRLIKADAGLARRVKVHPASAFNSVFGALGDDPLRQHNTFVVHLMTKPEAFRVAHMRAALQRLGLS